MISIQRRLQCLRFCFVHVLDQFVNDLVLGNVLQ